jgi:asparagine synthase (glutamine-hydrolysing)
LLLAYLFDGWPQRPPVILTGDGADTLFGDAGYRRVRRLEILNRIPGRKVTGQGLARIGTRLGRRASALAELLGTDQNDFRLYVNEVFQHGRAQELLGFDPLPNIQAHYEALCSEIPNARPSQRYAFLHLRGAAQGFIDKGERQTAAAGADAVHPFLMPDVVQLAFQLPDRLRLSRRWTKPVVRKLARRTLPRHLVFHRKMGFSAPRTEWLSSDPSLKGVLDAFEHGPTVLADYLDRKVLQSAAVDFRRTGNSCQDTLWILVSVERWCLSLGIS